jgi:hypothetical protein
MCATYAINRKERRDIKFQEIVDAYKEVNIYNKDIHEFLTGKINLEGR